MTTTRAEIVLQHIRGLAAEPTTDDPALLERFTTKGDTAAFTELVQRHGPMVFGVCRRVLREANDAEDAFQATFLVLARNAATIRRGESVGGWLYQVAYKTSLKARARAAVRQRRERLAGQPATPDPLAELSARDLLAVLDEELARLPPRNRAPLVLCYLEGRTREEAAAELGCPLGTLKRRLEEAREILRARLQRRGLGLPAALLTAGVASVAVPSALAASAALLTTTDRADVPGRVASLLPSAPAKIKAITATILVVGLVAVGLLLGRTPAPSPADEGGRPTPEAKAPDRPRPPDTPLADSRTVAVTGQVVLPDGKPAKDAHVIAVVYHLWTAPTDVLDVVAQTRTDREGQYVLMLPAPLARESSFRVRLRAAAAGYGIGSTAIECRDEPPATTIRLLPEHVIRGRLINLEGEAAAGVKLRVRMEGQSGTIPQGEPWPGPVTTDEKGRFTLRGLGKETGALFAVEDERFVRQWLRLDPGDGKADTERIFTLAPLRVLEGQVTQDDSGKPVANARVVVETLDNPAWPGTVECRTDEQGRYRIVPFAGRALSVRTHAPDGEPYVSQEEEVTWASRTVKQSHDVKLPRGVLVRGKVTEAASGRAVAGARMDYWPCYKDNLFYRPGLVKYPGTPIHGTTTGEDGAFRLAVLPGKGQLLVKGPTSDYVHVETSYHELYSGKPGGQRYYPDGLVALDLKPDDAPADVGVKLRRGVTVKGRALRPDGKPVAAGVVVCRRSFVPSGLTFVHRTLSIRDGDFELPGRDPVNAQPAFFLDAESQLGAVAEIAGSGPVTVRLAPCGSATVRLVDADGKSLAGRSEGGGLSQPRMYLVVTPGVAFVGNPGATKELQFDAVRMEELDPSRSWPLAPDAEGRVTFPTLLPGGTFRLWLGRSGAGQKEFTVKSGEKVELPDITVKPGRP